MYLSLGLSSQLLILQHQHHRHRLTPPLSHHATRSHCLLISPVKLSHPSIPHRESLSLSYPTSPRPFRVYSEALTSHCGSERDGSLDDLAPDSPVYRNTLRLVECSMFAAVAGLAYLISNSLAIENYFGCFFALPIVISSMRWGVAAARKTMVATAVLLLVLAGPVKALTYLLMHGILGFTMASLWRLQVKWTLSIILCTLVRAIGALGYVLTSSFLIRENILALITINVHATLTLIFNSLGFSTVPSMNTIYAIFGSLLLLNCCFSVFLLHILYALFLTKLGMKPSLALPKWLERALYV